jgi:hypothetical protein
MWVRELRDPALADGWKDFTWQAARTLVTMTSKWSGVTLLCAARA